MAFYQVLIPPPGAGGLREEIEQARVLPESFTFSALVFGGVWLLFKRLWLAFILYALVWGGLVRIFLFHHMTWSVNSICHTFGRRTYDTDDESRNNWVIAIPTLGEGWHNNHHHFCATARQGFFWWEVDVTYYVLRALAAIGLIWDVREPPAAIVHGTIADRSARKAA